MEALLSVAFDNLSSYDSARVKKGLKQVEGLLAQFCLSPSSSAREHRRKASEPPTSSTRQHDSSPAPPRQLARLADDAAFREFFKLQEGFEWNVALRLVAALDRLVARGADGQNDLLILSALDLMQGLLLVHPPSKHVFSREVHMNLLLDLVDPSSCPAIQCATLLTLVVALNGAPANTRAFEALDGLLTITTMFKARATSREVKFRLVEFLYFYLLPETPSIPSAAGAQTANGLLPQRSPSKLASAFSSAGAGAGRKRAGSGGGDDDGGGGDTRSTGQKEAMLGQHLHNVADLVKDLREMTPFGGIVC